MDEGEKLRRMETLRFQINEIEKAELEAGEEEEREALRACVTRLGERERLILERRYGLRDNRELTQKEVADLLGISQSYISRLEKKILARMRGELERL